MVNKGKLFFIYLLFCMTGATALVYQLTWTRDLTLIFGASYQANSIVLASFMGGLALGGYLLGIYANKFRNPFRVYAALEFTIAALAVAMPFILGAIDAAYVSIAKKYENIPVMLNVFRSIFAFLSILLPTFCMGGTLPLLVQYCTRSRTDLAKYLSLLYGINTLGAVFGTLLGGFALMPLLGVRNSQLIAAAINVVVAVAAYIVDRKTVFDEPTEPVAAPQDADETVATQPSTSFELYLVYWGTAVCGFCALAFEILWTRGLTLVTGASVYSFTIMLAAFLSGIALGGLCNALPFMQRMKLSVRFMLILVGIGVTSIAVTQCIQFLPQFTMELTQGVYGDFQGVRIVTILAISFMMLFIPAFLFGIAFPTCGQARTALKKTFGESVGECVGLNTAGAIFGALCAGYLLIPAAGLQKGMLWISAVILAYCFVLFVYAIRAQIPRQWLRYALCLAGLAGLFNLPVKLPAWDMHLMGAFRNNSGEIYYQRSENDVDVKKTLAGSSIIYYKEGRTSTIAVTQRGAVRSISVNGRTEATNSRHDLGLEKLISHVPCLIHPNPKKGLVIGLGAGVTLGSMTIQPQMEEVILVEIESAVLDGTRNFGDVNNHALDSRNLQVVIQDGRNFLLTTNHTFDVITADPIQPWNAGATYLFTEEYYEIAKPRLNPGGIMCQWLPLYELSVDNVRSVIAAMSNVFKYCMIWQVHFDSIIIGSDEPIDINIDQLKERIHHPALVADLEMAGIENVMHFLAHFVTATDGTKTVTNNAIVNTDDNLYLEFSSPHYMGTHTIEDNTRMFNTVRGAVPGVIEYATGEEGVNEFIAEWQRFIRAKQELLEYEMKSNVLRERCDVNSIAYLNDLHQRFPDFVYSRVLLSEYQENCGEYFKDNGDLETAKGHFMKALESNPNSVYAMNEIASILYQQNQPDQAETYLQAAIEKMPYFANAWVNLGKIEESKGNTDLAAQHYRTALDHLPNFSLAHYNLAVLLMKEKKYQDALAHFRKALIEKPDFAEAIEGERLILDLAG